MGTRPRRSRSIDPRRRRSLLSIAVGALAIAAGCAGPSRVPDPPRLAHVVLCWLKVPGDSEGRARIVAATEAFARRPEILDVVVGPPLASDRDVVDDSFDVGIVMRFASPGDLERFLADPEHRRAVAEVLQPLCARVVVYDVLQ